MSLEAEDTFIYLRYYVGHKGKFGHEFLEFEFQPNGLLRYANNSNYRRDSLIRKECIVSPSVLAQLRAIVEASEIVREDDRAWPMPDSRSDAGRQELEIMLRSSSHAEQHISFATSKFGSLQQVEQDARDPEGLKAFYYLVQDLRSFVFALISAHFKIKPV